MKTLLAKSLFYGLKPLIQAIKSSTLGNSADCREDVRETPIRTASFLTKTVRFEDDENLSSTCSRNSCVEKKCSTHLFSCLVYLSYKQYTAEHCKRELKKNIRKCDLFLLSFILQATSGLLIVLSY